MLWLLWGSNFGSFRVLSGNYCLVGLELEGFSFGLTSAWLRWVF